MDEFERLRIAEDVCVDIDEFLFQKLGDEIYNMDVELLNRGATLHLVTRSGTNELVVKTYKLELELMDKEIYPI